MEKQYVKFTVTKININRADLKTYKAKVAYDALVGMLPLTFEGVIQ